MKRGPRVQLVGDLLKKRERIGHWPVLQELGTREKWDYYEEGGWDPLRKTPCLERGGW